MSQRVATAGAIERAIQNDRPPAPVAPALISPALLPRLLCVIVMAFAPYEARPLVGAVKLFRGTAIQLSYRWATGQLVADPTGRAVLLWSAPSQSGTSRSLCRQLLGVVTATMVGVVLVLVCNGVFLLPLVIALIVVGVAVSPVVVAGLCIVGASLIITCWRGLLAHRIERELNARLPRPSGVRWRIDCLAAVPARSGHGGRLLDAFLDRADACDAEVVLHCIPRNVAFYRRHGFHVAAGDCPDGQRLMLRRARSPRPRTRQARDRDRMGRATSGAGRRTTPTATTAQPAPGQVVNGIGRSRG
jgi:GNAT superfamily N-acetyltransferase